MQINNNHCRVWLFYNEMGAVAQCPNNWGVGSAFHPKKIHILLPKNAQTLLTLHLLILYTATFKNQKNNSPLPMDPATPQPPHVAANPSSFCSSPSPATATATPSSLHCLPSPDTKRPPYPFYSILPKKNFFFCKF